MSQVKAPSDFSVVVLKDKLRRRGLSTAGAKADLMARLIEADPSGSWMEELEDDHDVPSVGEASGVEKSQSDVQKEVELLRRETAVYRKEVGLAERELALARREVEMLRLAQQTTAGQPKDDSPAQRNSPTISVASQQLPIKAVTELLSYFDGSSELFEVWEDQVRYLKATYQLTDDLTKIMIIQRLKDKAYEWFHSKREHIHMPADDLLYELKRMFHRHTSKMSLRTKFQERVWKYGETFGEYFHQKVILANRIQIDEEEMIEYIIAGIPEQTLRNQARVHRHRTKESLLSAFELVSLRERPRQPNNGGHQRAESTQSQKSSKWDNRPTAKIVKRCFNCGAYNHLGAECPVKSKGMKCFQCREFGHIAAKCPKKENVVKDACSVSRVAHEKCYKDVTINGQTIAALIDTGSDLSLMRTDHYIKIGAPPLVRREIKFRGVGSDNNKTLGEFDTEIVIDGTRYPITICIISDALMQHGFLLGTNFLATVDMSIVKGEVSIYKPRNENKRAENIPEIYNIDCIHPADEINLSHIPSTEHRGVIREMIEDYTVAKGREVGVKMNLVLRDDIPVYQRARRLSPSEKEEVNEHVREWLREGIIQPSLSEYASPVVLVKKKDGGTRLCIDYRKLNAKIIKDRYPLPLIDDQLDALQGAKIFSTLDLKNGFFHVPMERESRKYTAFVTPDGQYEFLYAPFGLCNSPAVFSKFIKAAFQDLLNKKLVLIYMDDFVIPSMNYEDGLIRLREVLRVAEQYGLNINWQKCHFLQRKIEYLGHIVGNGNIQPSRAKTEAVVKFPRPTNVRQLQSFLGLAGYFRKFVANYSLIARPLFNLLKSGVEFSFQKKEQLAFEQLKVILSTKPVLKLYNSEAETELHTDASMHGYGAILIQRGSDDKLHPVYYASGKTSEAESKYTSYELEVLAIIKALKKFRVYVLGIPFKIITDCRSFELTMKKRDLCVRVARWALLLEEFNYVIEHRSGKLMSHVDALSRNPLPSSFIIDEHEQSINVRLKRAQREDPDLKKIFPLVELQQYDGYVVRGGLLFKNDKGDIKLVVPKAMQSQITRRVHENGHFSTAKTELLLRKNYWFPNISTKVEKIIRNCVSCILAERKHGKQDGYLRPIDKGSMPLDVYHIDHLGPLASTKKRYSHIFIIIDAFSKFVWLYATRSTGASEVVNILRKQAVIFGNPRKIISDRGSAFTSREFKDYCKEENIQHSLITTGVPRENGQVERVNRTLIPILTKLAAPKPQEWHKFVAMAQQFLNATHHRSIGTTPFNVLFGTQMRLVNNPEIRELIEKEWMVVFREDRDELRRHARQNILKIQQENVKNFNKNRKEARRYREDDLVAIKRTQAGPGIKLASKYLGPYQIIKVLRNDRYLVNKIGGQEGPQQTSTSADHIKPWLYDATQAFSSEDDEENM